MRKPDIEQLVKAVRAHAIEHYNSHGWDIVTESWSDEEVAEAIGKARTEAGAIRNVRRAVAVVHEYREEIRSTAW